MNSRYWRALGRDLFVTLAIEYLICLGISYYLNRSDHFFYALLIMLGLWAVQILLWAKNMVVTLAHYYLMGKEQRIANIEAAFQQHRFPIFHDDLFPLFYDDLFF